MIKAVLFDMDGTLIDTERYYRVFWPKAMAEFGYQMTDEQVLSMRSLGRPFAPAKLKEWFGEELDYYAIRARRTEMMEECLDQEGIRLKPGVVEILEELRRRGIPAGRIREKCARIGRPKSQRRCRPRIRPGRCLRRCLYG